MGVSETPRLKVVVLTQKLWGKYFDRGNFECRHSSSIFCDDLKLPKLKVFANLGAHLSADYIGVDILEG